MQKTSVYLTDEEVARLRRLAKREGSSQAAVIRRAIRTYQSARSVDREFAIVGVAEGPGGSVAELTDDELLDGFGT